jgi:ABC-type lipoprotein release transport system permease subunit
MTGLSITRNKEGRWMKGVTMQDKQEKVSAKSWRRRSSNITQDVSMAKDMLSAFLLSIHPLV